MTEVFDMMTYCVFQYCREFAPNPRQTVCFHVVCRCLMTNIIIRNNNNSLKSEIKANTS